MEWFGLTLYGFQDPFKDMMRPDYKEPDEPPAEPELKILLRPEFDCNSGPPDGFAYKSYRRLVALRKKGIFKQVGPSDMYKYPGTCSMIIGWWSSDPALEGETWYKPPKHYPAPTTELSRRLNDALKIDKYARL